MHNLFRKIVRGFFLMVVVMGLSGLVCGEVWLWSKNREGGVIIPKSGAVVREAKVESLAVLATDNLEVTGIPEMADARPVMIRKYLEKYHSPLVDYADLIFELSETYGFEYYWIPAIAQQESNLCKKIPDKSFNCWGYGIHKKGTLRFENYELALKSYAEYLKRTYFDKGLNTPELIMKKYCPSSDGSWARGVNQFIDEIKRGS